MMRSRRLATALFILILGLSGATARALETPVDPVSDPILDAMQEELDRSREMLRLPDQPEPYFLSFWVQEIATASLWIRNGALMYYDPGLDVQRSAAAQIRVGSYQFDNSRRSAHSHYRDGSVGKLLSDSPWWTAMIPLEDSPTAIRSTLWHVADDAYKRALVDFHAKKALQALVEEPEAIPDFSRQEPSRYAGPMLTDRVDLKTWQPILEAVTGSIASHPEIQDVIAWLKITRLTDYYVNTEGTRIRQPANRYKLQLEAYTQAEDGMPLDDFQWYLVRDPAELPDEDALMADAQALVDELIQLRQAEVFPPSSSPAILDGSVAGIFIHEALGHRLEGDRQRRSEEGQTFKGKIGEQILPEFLTILDDPTLERFDGQTLAGFYRYDHEGTPAQRVVLVDAGELKSYLMSRTPVKGVLQSNGHGRAEDPDPIHPPMSRMANLLVQSTRQRSWDELKREMLEEARRQGRTYGLIIRKGRGGETSTETSSHYASGRFQAWRNQPVLVYRVDVDTGEEQLVRGVELVGTPLGSLERVVATGDRPVLFNGFCGAESGQIPVSTVSPALLTTQVELQRTDSRPRRPPILPSPFQTGSAPDPS